MKLILVKPIGKLKNIGEVISVKGGFARNYLIPQKYAVVFSQQNRELINSSLEELKSKNQQKILSAKAVAEKLEEKCLTFIKQGSADGKLFGSVSNRDVTDRICELEGSSLQMELDMKPIKYVGIHEVGVKLHPEVVCKIYVNVSKSELEAGEAFKKFMEQKTQVPGEVSSHHDENVEL